MPPRRGTPSRTVSNSNLRRGQTPAPKGNAYSVRHGAYARVAEAELEAKTLILFDALAEDAPVRAADGGLPSHDSVVVRMLAEVMVRRQRVRVEELRHGLETPDGRIRGVVEYGLRLDAQALDYARELGMTPASRAKLGLDLVRSASAAEQLSDHLTSTYGDGETIEGEATNA